MPLPTTQQSYAAAVLDLLTDSINHNLRKRLDTKLYIQGVTVLWRLLTHLAKSRTKLNYHWAELWRSLLSFVRFLNTYEGELKTLPRVSELVDALVDVLTLALTTGEAFLPDASAYDDFFYKLVESGEALTKLRDLFVLAKPNETSNINTLIGVSKHYQELIESQRAKKEHLGPRDVSQIIKQGYETLSIEAKEGLEQVEKYREADHKAELKKIARVAVADAAALVAG